MFNILHVYSYYEGYSALKAALDDGIALLQSKAQRYTTNPAGASLRRRLWGRLQRFEENIAKAGIVSKKMLGATINRQLVSALNP